MKNRKILEFLHCALFCHFRSLGIVISAIGLSVVVIAFIADVVSLYRAEKALGRHEIFLPFGLILLYASIAVMAPKGFFLTPTICALRRFLPGTIYLWFLQDTETWCGKRRNIIALQKNISWKRFTLVVGTVRKWLWSRFLRKNLNFFRQIIVFTRDVSKKLISRKYLVKMISSFFIS